MEHTNTNTEVQANQCAAAIETSDTSATTSLTTNSLHTPMAAGSDDEPEPCPACGARVMHQSYEQRTDDWLGIGELERCSLCGADYEHSAPANKKPLHERSIHTLLKMASDVEHAYDGFLSKPMTQEQMVQNREYFKRITAALASVNPYHIENRVEKFAAEQRWEELRGEAATLMEEVHGTGRIFYKYGCLRGSGGCALVCPAICLRCAGAPEPPSLGRKRLSEGPGIQRAARC